MENDLIGRSALLEVMDKRIRQLDREVSKTGSFQRLFGYDEARDEVRYAPAVDAVLVHHGHWIDDRTEKICSECNAVYSDEIIFMNKDFKFDDLPYCPNCGAKMDAEVKGCTENI